MKRLTERTEIAKAINFNKYPVIKIDIADRDEYGIKGTKVRIDNGTFRTGEPFIIDAIIRAYDDENVLRVKSYGTMLKREIGYNDYLKMVEYANAPLIKANQEIVIFLYNSLTKDVYAPAIIKTGDRIDAFCSTPLELEEFKLM